MPVYYGDSNGARPRQPSPEYHPPRPFASGAIPSPPNVRLPYYPHAIRCSSAPSLRPDARPRSLPPPARRKSRRHSPARPDAGPHSHIQDARDLISNTFSDSNSGLGFGLLAALVGGLTAHEVGASSVNKSRARSHGRRADNKSPLVPTIVGAAVAGLAANAFEKRIEVAKVRNAEKQEAWERRWGSSPDPTAENRGRRMSRAASSGIYYDGYAPRGGDFYERSAR